MRAITERDDPGLIRLANGVADVRARVDGGIGVLVAGQHALGPDQVSEDVVHVPAR